MPKGHLPLTRSRSMDEAFNKDIEGHDTAINNLTATVRNHHEQYSTLLEQHSTLLAEILKRVETNDRPPHPPTPPVIQQPSSSRDPRTQSNIAQNTPPLLRTPTTAHYVQREIIPTHPGSLEVDAMNVLRAITSKPDPTRHKGQAGKIAVIGGCREYTGAPYFAAISALKIGADLSHVFCAKDAAPIIQSYSPELTVHPVLEESYAVRHEDRGYVSSKVLFEVINWMGIIDCLVIGPGLGRDPFLLGCVSEIIYHARKLNIPIVIDGDGLFLVTNSPELVRGYPLAVLTPNVNEYKTLVKKIMLNLNVNDEDAPANMLDANVSDEDVPAQLKSLVEKMDGVTILRKGKSDLISDGDTVRSVNTFGSPRRCAGQGDILSGSVAVFILRARQCISTQGISGINMPTNPTVLGCIAGSALLRKAASLAFENKKSSTLTGDIIECLGNSLEDSCLA